MGLRAMSGLFVLGGLAACAKGGLADPSATSFATGAASTQAMTASSAADSETTAQGSDGEDGSASGTDSASATTSQDAETSASEVGGDACGNGLVDDPEQCDGDDLDGNDCLGAGFVSGALACTPQCTLDTSDCVSAACGDGTLQAPETCDCGVAGAACTAAQLGNQACTGLAAPTGGNYSGGTLLCTANCGFDDAGCTACGDGVLDAGEACDGASLAGQSCVSQGFDAGSLSCSAACSFNTGACVNYVCGNGACDPGEDSCSCASDCPDDPNSCGDPCECGFSGGNCFCDDACIAFGDCCANGPC